MALTDLEIRKTKPIEKQIKLTDSRGLYLLLKPNGSRWWRFDYRYDGKRKTISMGVYPEVSLKEARFRRDESRKLLASNIDPSKKRKALKNAKTEQVTNSFEVVAREWFIGRSPNWKENHSSRIINRLEKDIFPWLGTCSVVEITAPELLTVIRRIESRGALETAHRALANCSQVFRYAIATGRAQRDPSVDLRGALPPTKEKHHASITDPKLIGKLLRNIEGYQGAFITRCALQLAPLVFLRPGELRRAEWTEIDLEKSEWRIPAARMKMNAVHIVPLASQAVAILREIQPLTGTDKYVFPSVRTITRPMSDNTVLGALRRMGYSTNEMTGHGFRSMASTLLNEQGFNRDAIERQLAHAERDSVRAAYNYAEYLPERRRMMQQWADYLDKLKASAEINSINGDLKETYERR